MATRSHTPTTSLVIPPMLTAKNTTMVTMTLATTLAQFLRTQGTKVAIRLEVEAIVEAVVAVVAVATNLEVTVINTMVVIMAMHKKAVTPEAAIASSIIPMISRLQPREITIMRRRRKTRLLRATTRTLSLRTSTTLSRTRSTRSSTSSPPPSRPRSLRRSVATSTSKRLRSMST